MLSSCPTCGAVEPGKSAAAVLLGLVWGPMLGCSISMYGIAVRPDFDSAAHTGEAEDADGDGFVAESAGGDDCDDGDDEVYPEADEQLGDGVDSNCDGEDDT